MRILPLLVVLAGGLAAAEAPLPPGAKPVNLGSVGADEGPAWHPDGYLYFTGHEGILRRNTAGKTEVFRAGGGPNGLLFDAQGRLLVCEATGRRVIRIEADGKVTVLAERYEGHRFNSPNDLTVDSKGRIYFTDPRYGKRDDMEMRVEAVYRIDAPGKITRLTNRELERPNGLFVTPGDQYLYVADNNNNNVGGARKLYRFRLKPDGTLDRASRKLIFDWQNGRGPDGLKLDREGRIWVAGGVTRSNRYESADRFKGGVYVLSSEGKLLEFIAVPVDEVTNCAFGGPGYHTLFITAGGTLWSIPTSTEGLVPFHGAPAR